MTFFNIPWLDRAPWLFTALCELGQHEVAGAGSNPRILEYDAAVGPGAPKGSDEISWCAKGVNWCLRENNIEGTGSALARSFVSWGRDTELIRGAILVFPRPAPGFPEAAHVNFLLDFAQDESNVICIGGNQHDRWSIAPFARTQILAKRWPLFI